MASPNASSLISPEEAFSNALSCFTFLIRSLTSAPEGFRDIAQGTVASRPTTIFDIQGAPLFYDFPVEYSSRPAGTIRVAADKLLSHPWVSIQTDAELDLQALHRAASRAVESSLPGCVVRESKLVCFNYPRLGLLLDVRDASSRSFQRIYDLSTSNSELLPVPESGTGGPECEGEGVYSLFDLIPEEAVDSAFRSFSRVDELLNLVFSEACVNCKIPSMAKHKMSHSQQLKALNWSAKNQPEGLLAKQQILSVDGLRQESGTYCVIACIQMLLRFHGIRTNDTQTEIHRLLTQPPSLYMENRGILPENQVEAFKRCFGESIDAALDSSPAWDKAVKLIDAGLPFKSGIYAHARVCCGYHELQIGPVNTGPSRIERSYWINDPAASTDKPVQRLEIRESVDVISTDPWNVSAPKPRFPLENNHLIVAVRKN